MFCKYCGKIIDEPVKFCKYCGREIIVKEKTSSAERKICPFCKKEIGFDYEECPNCKHLLIEKIPSSDQPVHETQKFNHHVRLGFPRKIRKFFVERINYSKLLKYSVILLGIIFVVWIFSGDEPLYNSGGTKAPLPPPVKQISDDSVEFTPPTPAVSLPNGTILKKNSVYLRGDGELQIKNGTGLDAVAKLIHGGTSVLTVYIKANSTYTMLDISDGIYWLAFAQGLDWDSVTQKFRRNTQYSVFEDTFDFTTTYSQYTIFEVTLNPVIGGTAETNDIPGSQFDQY